MDKSRKVKDYQRGLRAENLAAWWLRFKGFHIAKKRFKTRYGEIDLIARRGNLIIIVEVKARPNLQAAMEAVSYKARRRIEACADAWLTQQNDREKLSLRFDLIAIIPRRLPCHVPAFFQAGE